MLLPACAALALVSYVTGSGARIDEELHLIVPSEVTPGQSLPVRAHFYAGLDAIEGPRLAQPETHARLLGPTGALLAQTRLAPGLDGSLEGALAVPESGTTGPFRVRLEARVEQRRVAVEAQLAGRSAGAVPPPRPRPLPALQGFAPGPIEPLGPGRLPRLSLRVAGGVCVPEAACELLVHVGEPAAALRVEPSPSVEPIAAAAPPGATTGIVVLRVKTHGPEARFSLLATRDGLAVARRRVRLPVALSASALRLPTRLYTAPAQPRAALGPEAGSCILDAFQDGRWRRTGTLSSCDGDGVPPFAPLSSGLWRLQARRDPFAAEAAGVAVIQVLESGQSPAAALRELAGATLRREPDDAFARDVLAHAQAHVPTREASAAYLFAGLEQGVFAPPPAHSSLPAARAALLAHRKRVQGMALGVLALCGLTLALLLARRGLSAAGRAGRIMQAAGEAPADLRRQRRRRVLNVLASAAAMALAFVAMALYVLARN